MLGDGEKAVTARAATVQAAARAGAARRATGEQAATRHAPAKNAAVKDTATKAPAGDQPPAKTRRSPMREAHDGVARSLRQAYQQTVDEAVPDSMLDLIKRLS